MSKISNILLPIAMITFSIYFGKNIQLMRNPDVVNGKSMSPYSEFVDEPFCSGGVGILHHDVWDVNKSSDAVDILYGNRKLRMFGFNSWFDKTAYGSIVVNSGCNIWDNNIHFDERLARRSGSVIGIISEQCIDVTLNDDWYNFAENSNIEAYTVYTNNGARVFNGMYQEIFPSFHYDKSGTKMTIIVDYDGNQQGANLIYKWSGGHVNAYHFIETGLQYRLAVASQMEESFKLY